MALSLYDEKLVYDRVLNRGVPGRVAVVTDAFTGVPVEGLMDLNGQPLAALVSNSQGYIQGFQLQDGPPVVKVQVGNIAYIQTDYGLIGEAAQAAQDAAASAEAAIGLVLAPSDEVIALNLGQNGSLSSQALRDRLSAEADTTDGLISMSDKERALYPAATQILDLARQDGWQSVYNVDDPKSLVYTAGMVTGIRDGLKSNPDMTRAATVSELQSLGGKKYLRGGQFTAAPFTGATENFGLMAVAFSTNEQAPGNQYLVAGNARPQACLVMSSSNQRVGMGDGAVNTYPQSRAGNIPAGLHVFDYVSKGAESVLTIDGALHMRRATAAGVMGALRFGGYGSSATNQWTAPYGLVMVHPAPSNAVMARMRKLVMSLYGIQPAPPNYWQETRAITVDSRGSIVLAHGDPYWVNAASIMSMTKMINALTMRQWITDAMLDEQVTIVYDDYFRSWESEPIFQENDVVSWRSLLYAMAMPSSDLAPRAIARICGERYIPNPVGSSAPAFKRFLLKMTQNCVDWGFNNAHIDAVGGGGKVSLFDYTKVVQKMLADPVLREIFGTRTKTIQITGVNARSINLRHTIDSGTATDTFSEFIAGKTGTGGGRSQVSAAWTHPDTEEEMVTVIMSVKSDLHSRYHELFNTIEQVKSGIEWFDPTHRSESGTHELSTGVLDVTDLFPQLARYETTTDDPGVYLNRAGNTVTLNFQQVTGTGLVEQLNLLDAGFRPPRDEYGLVWDYVSSAPIRFRVSALGSVQIYAAPGQAFRLAGQIAYTVSGAIEFPAPPFPGYPGTRI